MNIIFFFLLQVKCPYFRGFNNNLFLDLEYKREKPFKTATQVRNTEYNRHMGEEKTMDLLCLDCI